MGIVNEKQCFVLIKTSTLIRPRENQRTDVTGFRHHSAQFLEVMACENKKIIHMNNILLNSRKKSGFIHTRTSWVTQTGKCEFKSVERKHQQY